MDKTFAAKLSKMSYKELQNEAMSRMLPANLKHKQLLGVIIARHTGQEHIVDAILADVKRERLRKKRRMALNKKRRNTDGTDTTYENTQVPENNVDLQQVRLIDMVVVPPEMPILEDRSDHMESLLGAVQDEDGSKAQDEPLDLSMRTLSMVFESVPTIEDHKEDCNMPKYFLHAPNAQPPLDLRSTKKFEVDEKVEEDIKPALSNIDENLHQLPTIPPPLDVPFTEKLEFVEKFEEGYEPGPPSNIDQNFYQLSTTPSFDVPFTEKFESDEKEDDDEEVGIKPGTSNILKYVHYIRAGKTTVHYHSPPKEDNHLPAECPQYLKYIDFSDSD